MRGRAVSVALVGLFASGCDVAREPVSGAPVGTARRGDHALAEARRQALGAEYLAVHMTGGPELLFGRDVVVIKRHGRVLAWEDKKRSFTAPKGRRCFERETDFNRADASDLRRAAAPPDVAGARLIEGRHLVLAREEHIDFADTEFEIRIDDSGRPISERQRSARSGVLAPGRWTRIRYKFVTAAQFHRRAGPPPRPRRT
jgi:hypothetical protein